MGASPNEDGALLIFFLSPRRNEWGEDRGEGLSENRTLLSPALLHPMEEGEVFASPSFGDAPYANDPEWPDG
jgi:hypothetical protein